jgi:xylulokinase
MLAAGAGDEATVCKRPPTQRVFTPDAARAAVLAPRLKRYRALYPAEKGAR